MKSTALLSVLSACTSIGCGPSSPRSGPAASTPSAYERVQQSRVLRCGYFIEAPFTVKNEDSGQLSGLTVDLVEAIADELGLTVQWTEHIAFGTFPEDLKNNRYDMICGSVFVLPRAGRIDYTQPYAFVEMHGYVQPSTTRLDVPFDQVPWQKISIAGLDGEGATTAVKKRLPQAKLQLLPQLTSIPDVLMHVASGKADIAFVLPTVFAEFNHNNPGVLRRAKLQQPLYTYAVALGVAHEQHALKAMVNHVITQWVVSGELEALFAKHDAAGHFRFPKIATGTAIGVTAAQ